MNLKLLAVLCALAAPASAQDELGLDFSEEKTPVEFRPSIAFIGVTPEHAEEPLAARGRLLEGELFKLIGESERFAAVKSPAEAAAVSPAARTCLDFACLETLAEKLGVQRLIMATLAKSGPGTVLTLYGFDPTLPAVLPMSVESGEKQEKAQLGGFAGIAGKSQAQRDKEFLGKTKGPFNEMLKKISTPLGKLVIDVIEQKAVTRVRGKELGTGSFEKAMPVGTYEVEVTSDEYQPFSSSVTIEPAKKAVVKVSLVAKPVEVAPLPVVSAEPAPAFYKRPGLYVVLAGAVVMGLGFMFGGMAKSTENRARDSDLDGYIDITRSQAQTAKTQALLANILVATGGVMMGAGAIWAFVIPLIPSKSGGQAPAGPAPGDPEGSGFGFSAAVGGTF